MKHQVRLDNMESELRRRVAIQLNNQTTQAMVAFANHFLPFGEDFSRAPREWYENLNQAEIGLINVNNTNPMVLLGALRQIMVDRVKAQITEKALGEALDKLTGAAEEELFVTTLQSISANSWSNHVRRMT